MKRIYKLFSTTTIAALPLVALVSCVNKDKKSKEEDAKDDLKKIKSKLNKENLKTLIKKYSDKNKKLYEKLKSVYSNKPIIKNKKWNEIIGPVTSNVSNVDFNNNKISFKIDTSFTQEGITYHVVQEAFNEPIEIKKINKNYILGINIQTTQYNSKNENIEDPTMMKVDTNFVSIRDIFGEWDDQIKNINSDQNDNIVRNITLFHTNDTHGHMETDGGKYNKYIGMSGVAAYVKAMQPDILLSGGDFMQGTGISNYDHGKSAMEIADLIGFDAIAAGNHEFDWGYKTLLGRAKTSLIYSDNSFYNKNVNIKNFNPDKGPLSNSYDINTKVNEHVLPGLRTKIIKGNLHVGIISLTTPDVSTKVNPSNVDDVTVDLLSKYTQKEIDNLREAGMELIIIVGHMGSEASSVETSEKLMKKISGVDLVVDGHSHQLYKIGKTFKDKEGKDIPIAQTGAYTRNIGVMNFDYDKKNKKIINFHNKYVNYDEYDKLKLAKIDKVEEIIKKAKDAYDKYAGQDAFKLNNNLSDGMVINGTPTRTVRKFETSSGNYFADAILWKTISSYPMDNTIDGNSANLDMSNTIGFVNSGGVRSSVQGNARNNNMTKIKDWIDLSPFNNSLSTIRIDGKQLWGMFMHSAKSWNDGPFAQVSKNVKVEYEVYKGKKDADGNKTNSFNIVKSISINGQAVPNDNTKKYYVTGNDFLRNGGDGYNDIWTSPVEVYNGGTLSDILIEYGKDLTSNSNSNFTWSDYNSSEIKPKDATRIIVNWKDKEAKDFIGQFN